jgi:hypothetical protein
LTARNEVEINRPAPPALHNKAADAAAASYHYGDTGGTNLGCGADGSFCEDSTDTTPMDSSGGDSYAYCIALSSKGQKCWNVVEVYVEDTMCQPCVLCAKTQRSGGCKCDDDKKIATGTCSYW